MRWRRALVAIALGAPVVGLLGFGLTRDPGVIISPLPGQPAPPFTLAAFSSGEATPLHPMQPPPLDSVSLLALRGQVVVMNFWASWCLACRDEHQALQDVSAMYGGSDVQFLGVLYNDNVASAKRWLRDMGPVPYPSLLDPGARTAIDYGLYGVPETFFIGRDGRVAYKHLGPLTRSVLEQKIQQLRQQSLEPGPADAPLPGFTP